MGETLGPYDRVDIPGRDEFGIPTGEHTLTCGCRMKGRALLEACGGHQRLIEGRYRLVARSKRS